MNAHADRAASSLVLVLRFLSPRRDMKAPGYVDMAASSLALFLVRATTSSYEGSTGELGAKGFIRTRAEIPKEPVQSSASSSHVFLARPGIPKESVQSSLALFPYGARASFLIGSQS